MDYSVREIWNVILYLGIKLINLRYGYYRKVSISEIQ